LPPTPVFSLLKCKAHVSTMNMGTPVQVKNKTLYQKSQTQKGLVK
jgi:hypothetical protein